MGSFLADDLKRHNCDTLDDFYASIGYGGVMLSKIMPRLKELYVKSHGAEEEEANPVAPVVPPEAASGKDCIVLDRIDDCVFKFAQCCNRCREMTLWDSLLADMAFRCIPKTVSIIRQL